MNIKLANELFKFNKYYYVNSKLGIRKVKLSRIYGSLDSTLEFCDNHYCFIFMDEKPNYNGRSVWYIPSGLVNKSKDSAKLSYEVEGYMVSPGFGGSNIFRTR